MLDFIALSAIAWFNIFKETDNILQPLELFAWEQSAIFNLPSSGQDSVTETLVKTYLQNLASQEFNPERQGVWVQSGWTTPVSNQGTIPLPAASLTKIATTLAALSTWGAEYQFPTEIYLTGEIANGIVTGDLIIKGSGDPFFVWEEAIALGNALNQLGIREIQGNLLLTDKFYMNYQQQSLQTGELFKQALDLKLWQSEITQQYSQMPVGTKQPQIAIAGQVRQINQVSSNAQLLISHRSLPLAEILRQMNIYSNNQMAQMLADLLGGADAVAEASAKIAGFATTEIELINGSGLGEENRISPRAVCQMLITIDRLLQSHSFNAADLFPTAGRDIVGTVQDRALPKGATIKTGTLDNVSALAGVVPTSDRGNVYFSIMNYGPQVEYFRQQQDKLLNELVQNWEILPYNLQLAQENNWYLGDPERNKLN
ncbi:MAG TPA: D-alanyl-D-alanine carboxypeptidase [Coleofasciculaceae cyanobacterium]|jgi:D-alanyl-D-alanine carboxypeptidase/D-alanyl-D-alanine-endopeptidase (penicillin-binding protein 4)